MEQTITSQNLESLMNSNKVMVIDFWATWCGPCRKMAPIVEQLANDYADTAIIGKCDIEENEDLAVKFGIRNIPTILFIKDGVVRDKQVGATTRAALEEKLKALL